MKNNSRIGGLLSAIVSSFLAYYHMGEPETKYIVVIFSFIAGYSLSLVFAPSEEDRK